jgi:hypothetical protein
VQAQRNPEEEGDYMAFEQLVAEAAAKKESKKKSKEKKASNSEMHTGGPSHMNPSDIAADAPNVPRSK